MTPRVASTIGTHRRVWLRELLLVSGLLLAFLALLFAVDHTAPNWFDRQFAQVIQAIRWGELSFIPTFASDLGGGVYGFYLVPAVAFVGFAVTRQWRLLALLAAVFALHYLLISPKQFILAYRPSPLFGVEGAGGLQSFPSGHVEWAVSFYGLLAFIGWRTLPARWRWTVIPAYALVVLGTMVGRVELGRHWPLDTLAGLLLGLVALRLLIVLHALPVGRPRLALAEA